MIWDDPLPRITTDGFADFYEDGSVRLLTRMMQKWLEEFGGMAYEPTAGL
jgi:hypothetical protein